MYIRKRNDSNIWHGPTAIPDVERITARNLALVFAGAEFKFAFNTAKKAPSRIAVRARLGFSAYA